jgi:hypothetical protein
MTLILGGWGEAGAEAGAAALRTGHLSSPPLATSSHHHILHRPAICSVKILSFELLNNIFQIFMVSKSIFVLLLLASYTG